MMVVEALTQTLDTDRAMPKEIDQQESNSSVGSRPTEPSEDRWAEAVLQLIRTNGKVQSAIMDLVLSSPYIQWEL